MQIGYYGIIQVKDYDSLDKGGVIMVEMENKGISLSDIYKEILVGFVKVLNKG